MKKLGIKDVMFFLIIIVLVAITAFSKVYWDGSDESPIGVHVKGEVVNPGYYELTDKSRVKDAIKSAGGATENADLDSLNLAMYLRDGEEITVPAKNENLEATTFDNTKININSADIKQLCKISGVGETLANNIINYRKKNGVFESLTELKNVSGIGEAKFSEIEKEITID